MVTPASGPGWVLLPHTAGFIDPLHSTGIAHSLCAIEQLAGILQEHWGRESMDRRLIDYSRRLECELALIDRLVAGCYRGLGHVELFRSFSMLYFAAATNYEIARLHDHHPPPAFLCAEDESLSRIVDRLFVTVDQLAGQDSVSARDIRSFQETVTRAIEPYNHVGLCDLTLQHMYIHTLVQ